MRGGGVSASQVIPKELRGLHSLCRHRTDHMPAQVQRRLRELAEPDSRASCSLDPRLEGFLQATTFSVQSYWETKYTDLAFDCILIDY